MILATKCEDISHTRRKPQKYVREMVGKRLKIAITIQTVSRKEKKKYAAA